ncbi:MAG TPA: PqqD family protein, partial [Chloroflexota bacterium]|nr:PqqD family protein [Chloroflexota bacterium]
MSTVRARQYTIREAVVWTEIQDESVLLDLETGRYFELNAIGTEIWRMISRRADEDEIVHALLA